ncbi:hypothetical protein ALO97_05609 [Pseudomonas syringae pv. tagetis]|nr:hypothetical protein ALO97_05609 [Pseudomonas syringae pv. tagetis]
MFTDRACLLERGQTQGKALGDVAQFPYIARPVVAHQVRTGLPVQQWRLAVKAQRRQLQEVFEQLQNVFTALTQWRQFQRDDVQAVVQVAAKLIGLAQGIKVGLGRRNDSAIHGNGLIGAKPFKGSLLKDAQQLDLQIDRHAFHFIEKQRAIVGVFYFADAPFACAGKGIGFVPEDLRLEQAFCQPAAIEGYELAVLAPTEVMQAARDELLASTGLAFDKHIGGGVGDIGNQCTQVLHCGRAADYPAFQRIAFGQLLAQRPDFPGQPALLERASGYVDQTLGRKGFLHEIVSTIAHCIDGHGDVAMTGDQHDRQAAVTSLETAKQLKAVDTRQTDVTDDDTGKIVTDALQSIFGAGYAFAGNVFQREGLLAAEQYMRVVFDDQDGQVAVYAHGCRLMSVHPGQVQSGNRGQTAGSGQTLCRRHPDARRSDCPRLRRQGSPTVSSPAPGLARLVWW